MSTRDYEVVVVGGSISALVTARILEKRGYDVGALDNGEVTPFESDLLESVAWSHDGSAVMTRVHQEIGLNPTVHHGALLDLVYADQRIRLRTDTQQNRNEFARGFGTAAGTAVERTLQTLADLDAQASAFLLEAQGLPPRGFWQERAQRNAANRHRAGTAVASAMLDNLTPPLEALILGVLPFVTSIDARALDDVRVAHVARPIRRLLRGLSVQKQSIRAELGRLTPEIDAIHGAVETIELENRRFKLSVTDRTTPITARALVDGTAGLAALEALPLQLRRRKLADTLETGRPKGQLHSVVFELNADVVPEQLSRRALLLNGRGRVRDQDAQEPEDRPILLERLDGLASPGRTALLLRHPVTSAERHAAQTSKLNQVIRARVSRLLPFFDEGEPKILPVEVPNHPLFDRALDPVAGIGGIPTCTRLRGAFVAGPSVLPGLGMEGEYLAALQAADQLDRELRSTRRPRKLRKRLSVS